MLHTYITLLLFSKHLNFLFFLIYFQGSASTVINACQFGATALGMPWVSLGLLYNQSPPGVGFLNKIIFYRMGFLAPCPTLNLEDSLSLDSTL
jgi:hypothetical protein